MEYKEFRLVILNPENTRATLPSTVTRKGKIQWSSFDKKIIDFFHSMLKAGNINNREDIELFGSLLYNVLFNKAVDDLDDAFRKACDDTDEENRKKEENEQEKDIYLRLVLEFEPEARELATLPWEYLFCPSLEKKKGYQIATKAKLILTRHVPLSDAFATLKPSEKTLRILIVTSQPKDLDTVLADPVIDAIKDLKQKLPDTIEIQFLPQPDRRTFFHQVSKIKPHVLHFIGHGRSGALAFVNKEDGNSSWVSEDDFSDYFQEFQPRLIFLHSCEGASSESYEGFRGLALQLVYSKVPAVVAMQFPIKNKEAILFARKFYKSLTEGKPIDVAVQEGRFVLGMFLDEKHFSSRAFGSPVAFLQSAEGIIIAEAQPKLPESEEPGTPPVKVPCPNPDCREGLVAEDDILCQKCEELLEKCPEGHVIVKNSGKCSKCGWGYGKKYRADPLKEEPAIKKPILQTTFEGETIKAQKRQ